MINILLVEDDKEICFILTELLKRNHYNVSAYHNGIEAIEALSSKKYDLMLLDLMLPDLPGEKILFHLKKHNNSIPVIVISAKNQPEIRINLLRSGADDYITKPFYHEEVLARIESVLRRCSESPQTEYSFKDIRINVDDHKVLVNNTELTLTTTEYNLLQLLIKHPKQTFTKESLYQLIWGKDYISDDNTLNVHISKLRKKLEHIGNQAPYIDTIWGIGYKLHRYNKFTQKIPLQRLICNGIFYPIHFFHTFKQLGIPSTIFSGTNTSLTITYVQAPSELSVVLDTTMA